MDQPLLEVKNLKKYFPIRKGFLGKIIGETRAVDDVSLTIKQGETFALVGESGCGKSTAGRAILRLVEPTGGSVLFRSKKLARPGEAYVQVMVTSAPKKLLKKLRGDMQIIYQDPYSSLDPRMTVLEIVAEPLVIHGETRGQALETRVQGLLEAVGLKSEYMNRYPHEFSGGQRQRIGIARALALNPQLIIADEPISALDVSVQAQVINLLEDLQEMFGLTYLFISHDLSVVRHIGTRVGVMYLGRIVEMAPTEELFSDPKHPYTEALMSAVPVPDPDYSDTRIQLYGEVGNPADPPSGCTFHPRCLYAKSICKSGTPASAEIRPGHFVSCHLAESLRLRPANVRNEE